MKSRCFALLIAISLLFCVNTFSQPTLLWKIECDSCPGASYLLGTAHYISGNYFAQHLALANLILHIGAIATESGGTRSGKDQYPVDSFFIRERLRDIFTTDQYKSFSDSFFKYERISLDSFPHLSPLAALVMIQNGQEKQEAKTTPLRVPLNPLDAMGMDNALEEMARERNIPLYALETKQQFVEQFFRRTPAHQQAELGYQWLTEKQPTPFEKLY